MVDKQQIMAALFLAIDEFNEQATTPSPIEKAEQTVLLGPQSGIDSLGLVRLILTIEQQITDQFDVDITLADERAMSQRNSPFRSVTALAEYIETLLEEQGQ